MKSSLREEAEAREILLKVLHESLVCVQGPQGGEGGGQSYRD